MFKQSISSTCAVLFFAGLVYAQENLAGHWEGSIPVNFYVNRPMGISLDLAKNANSEWVASMGVPALNATGLVVQSVKVNRTHVSFVAVEMMMTKFDLTLGAGGIMKGTITTQQGPPNSASVEFKRTGEPGSFERAGRKLGGHVGSGSGRFIPNDLSFQEPAGQNGVCNHGQP